MRRTRLAMLSSLVVWGAIATGCSQAPPPTGGKIEMKPTDVFAVLPASVPASASTSQAMIDLGRMLYYEPRLSKSQQISCNFVPRSGEVYGVDGNPTSDGHKGQMGSPKFAPTVYNAAGHIAQFWDGRARTSRLRQRALC